MADKDAMYSPAELKIINARNAALREAREAEAAEKAMLRKRQNRQALEARNQRLVETSCGNVEETGNPRNGCDCQTCVRRRKAKASRQRARRHDRDPDAYWEAPLTNYQAARFEQYGLTEEAYMAMLDGQDHRCAICGTTKPGGKNARSSWHIDHDHKTGAVRGLLCRSCNWGLGQFKDSVSNLEAAIQYLSKTEDR